MNPPDTPASPYREALGFIQRNPGTGGAGSLAKLILSLWNDECCYSFRECVSNLDGPRTALALRMAAEFAAHGETQELIDIGHRVCKSHPLLWDQGQAGTEAKRAWRRSVEAARRREE